MMIRVGLVGCGAFGACHARAWGDVPDTVLCSVFDPAADRARAVAADSSAVAVDSLDSLLSAVDAVDVVTPPGFHSDVVRRCLLADRHVLAEKPLGTSPRDARDLAKLAEAKGRVLMVGYLERFHPWIGAALAALPGPQRIETRRINCEPPTYPSIGIVHDLMSHDIDLVTRWIDAPVAEVAARAHRGANGIIDEVAADLRFDDGRAASLAASWRGAARRREVRVFANGSLQRIDLLDQGHGVDLLRTELASFADTVRGSSMLAVSAIDAARTLSVAQRVVDALRVTEDQCG